MTQRTVEQLKAEHSDIEWRARFVQFCDLVEILADCTIADSYVIPDELNAAIKLSDAGNMMLDKLTRKEKVNPKDARLMCALSVGHDELFIDIDATDVEKLANAINEALLDQTVRFPFTHGRNLYDAYAELFEDEKDLLTNEETIRLLKLLPHGVFQYGEFTVGPYGLRKSLISRSITSSRRVPAYHCARLTCHSIHSVVLQTGHDASVNRDREKFTKVIQSSPAEANPWWELAAELSGFSQSYYRDQRAGVVMPLVGDTLSDSELRSLVCGLFNSPQGELRKAVSDFIEVKNAETAVAKMDRAQLLQVVLVAREEAIAATLDNLVQSDQIRVPLGDIRTPVMNRNIRSGAFRLRAELGHYGTRFISDSPGLALLRQRRLLGNLYNQEHAPEVQELEWQLRGIDVEDLEEKLESFYRSKDPSAALRRLVLARRSNVISACHEVGISSSDHLSDDEIIDALMWKLGFPVASGDDPHAEFWGRHERLGALTQSSNIGNVDRLAEAAAPYFARLEGLLLDSLAFISWALLVDHTRRDFPFSYDDHDDRAEGLKILQAARASANSSDTRDLRLEDDHVDLGGLFDGFNILAKHLERCRDTADQYLRPATEFPDYDQKTDLKRFLFRSTIPFLDLSKPSQERIIKALNFVGNNMRNAKVNLVRNDYAHHRRTTPDVTAIELALESVRQSVAKIENLGFCRLLFTPSSVSTDAWGQSLHDFSGPRSFEHTFARPTQLDWMGLPQLTEPQYLVRAASFIDPTEVLRFTRRYRSEFSDMWAGFPNRRKRGPGSPNEEEVPAHPTDVEVAAS